jgi:hypothetical protein
MLILGDHPQRTCTKEGGANPSPRRPRGEPVVSAVALHQTPGGTKTVRTREDCPMGYGRFLTRSPQDFRHRRPIPLHIAVCMNST